MDRQTEQLKAELKRVAVQAAERAICRRLDSLVLPHVPNAIKGRTFTLRPVRQNAEGHAQGNPDPQKEV